VRQTDDGTYVCVASNGLGEPVRREVALQVTGTFLTLILVDVLFHIVTKLSTSMHFNLVCWH